MFAHGPFAFSILRRLCHCRDSSTRTRDAAIPFNGAVRSKKKTRVQVLEIGSIEITSNALAETTRWKRGKVDSSEDAKTRRCTHGESSPASGTETERLFRKQDTGNESSETMENA